MKFYRAFSLLLSSEIDLDILPEVDSGNAVPDVRIIRGDPADLSEAAYDKDENGCFFSIDEHSAAFGLEDGTWFRISDGNTVSVCASDDVSDGLLQVYILGSCFGAILQQRGIMLLHGSCICRDRKAYIITGESGNGKSTLAREFLRNGWKLVTDDVSAIRLSHDGIPYVLPSYPSQKLWLDVIEKYSIDDCNLRPLWQEERREKFSADVSGSFIDSESVLCGVIWLIKGKGGYKDGCRIEKISGFPVVDLLMRNLYRPYFRYGTEGKNRMFQQCVDLSGCVDSYMLLRDVHGDTSAELYNLAIGMLEADT